MVAITVYYANLTRSMKLKPWPGGPQSGQLDQPDQGDQSPISATSDCLPSHPTKDRRAPYSCFDLIGADQCGILMVDAGSSAAFNPPQVKHLWFQYKKQVEVNSQSVIERSIQADGEFVHITQCSGLVTNDSNHCILHQPDQVSKTETMARGTKVVS